MQELLTEPFAAEREWTVDGIPVLSATLSLPRPVDRDNRLARRLGRFYALQGRAYLRYCEKLLFPQAAGEYRMALQGSAPLPHYTAVLSYQVTLNQQGLWSLYTDCTETLGTRREVQRRGDTWDLSTAYPVPLASLFPRRFPVRKTLLQAAEAEIARQEAAGVARYHDHWRQALRRRFSRENFYLTPEGLRFFWPMYAIASAVEGIPTFLLPYAKASCHLPEEG